MPHRPGPCDCFLTALLLTLTSQRVWAQQCIGRSATLPAAECAAFAQLFDSTGGSGWVSCSSSRVDPCACEAFGGAGGVKCELVGKNHRITAIHLGWNNLEGTLPPSVGNLTRLQSLDLGGNAISGTIPSAFEHLDHLTHLDLLGNKLRGSIPPELVMLKKLRVLWLFDNHLRGIVPPLDFETLGDACGIGGTNDFFCPLPAGASACNRNGVFRTALPVVCSCSPGFGSLSNTVACHRCAKGQFAPGGASADAQRHRHGHLGRRAGGRPRSVRRGAEHDAE